MPVSSRFPLLVSAGILFDTAQSLKAQLIGFGKCKWRRLVVARLRIWSCSCVTSQPVRSSWQRSQWSLFCFLNFQLQPRDTETVQSFGTMHPPRLILIFATDFGSPFNISNI